MNWRKRAQGILIGTLGVWALNQGRILVLFYANRSDKELFNLLHGTVAPLVLIVLTSIAFLFYIDRAP
jgi:exosortase/archaeosortase family protein